MADLSPIVMPFINSPENSASSVSKVEVLGFHKLNDFEKNHFQGLFSRLKLIGIEESYIDMATNLRQHRSMSLGDAMIAATALENSLPLVTCNVRDFQWIDGLEMINPFEQ